jgi:hypothetical protein
MVDSKGGVNCLLGLTLGGLFYRYVTVKNAAS